MGLVESISFYCKGLKWKGNLHNQDLDFRISEGKLGITM